MAKVRTITRTITFTNAEVMALNVETAEVLTLSIKLSGEFEGEEAVLKAAKERNETAEIKLVKVINWSTTTKRYGMLEDVFIRYAVEM